MKVYLIGAGPGDPELITLKAVKALNNADVVIYDRLANEEILEHATKNNTNNNNNNNNKDNKTNENNENNVNNINNVKLIYVGKKAGEHYKTQDEINEIIIAEAKNPKNKNIVRLKGGDPFVFGRGGEEILAIMKENIPFEIIPGVTSAIGAPTSLGLPITHRAIATSFTVVTGHEDPTKDKKQVKWDYTADTIIILMGIGNIKENTAELAKHKGPKTPVCVIENGTLPNERVIFGTLEDIAEKEINTPAILIVGNVVDVYKEIKNFKD